MRACADCGNRTTSRSLEDLHAAAWSRSSAKLASACDRSNLLDRGCARILNTIVLAFSKHWKDSHTVNDNDFDVTEVLNGDGREDMLSPSHAEGDIVHLVYIGVLLCGMLQCMYKHLFYVMKN